MLVISRSHGVVVSTLDFESSDPSSNLGGTSVFFIRQIGAKLLDRLYIILYGLIHFLSRWFRGVVVSTLDSESSDPSSNLGGTLLFYWSPHFISHLIDSCYVIGRDLQYNIDPNIYRWSQYYEHSRVAQWKRAGPITQRSVDRNHALLKAFLPIHKKT